MPSWERKQADTIAAAIHHFIRNNPSRTGSVALLTPVQTQAQTAAQLESTSMASTMQCQAELCKVCRGSHLYTCDVAQGWSPNCAFVKANNPP